MKSFYGFNFKEKKVLLRVDINSPVFNKKITLSERIIQAAKTISELKKRGAKIIVIAHQGRKGGSDFTSLKQHAKLLSRFTKVKFVADVCGKKAVNSIKKLRKMEAILLENLRFLDEEQKKTGKFVEILSSLCDIYVNDAFSVSHRTQASVVGFPKLIKSCYGPNMQKEIDTLKKLKIKNVLFILGGSKTEENLLLLDKNKRIIVGGRFGQLYLFSKGFNFGKNNNFLDVKNVSILKEKSKKIKIISPVDFAVKQKNKRKEFFLGDFPNDYEVFDIGKKTMEIFKKEIKKAKVIFMKGPLGYCEEKKFRKGTGEILKEISRSGAYSVLGGGHLSTLIKELKISKNKFGYVSLSGGALVSYIAGKKLPGIEAIKDTKFK